MPSITPPNHNTQARSRKDGAFVWVNKKLLKALLSQLSGDEVKVYLALTLHSGNTGTVWPSQKTIAEEAGCSRRSVQRALDRLEMLKMIHREPRRGRALQYRLLAFQGDTHVASRSETHVASQGDTRVTQNKNQLNETQEERDSVDLATLGQEQDSLARTARQSAASIPCPHEHSRNALVSRDGRPPLDLSPPRIALSRYPKLIAEFWNDVMPMKLALGVSEAEALDRFPEFWGTKPAGWIPPVLSLA